MAASAWTKTIKRQRSGLIITISSTAGLIGFEFGTAYAASKFGLEGWMQSLQAEVEPFGINTITVNPGFFRTELLTEQSTNFAERTIEDYNERRAKIGSAFGERMDPFPKNPMECTGALSLTPHVGQRTPSGQREASRYAKQLLIACEGYVYQFHGLTTLHEESNCEDHDYRYHH